jgi:hypothetical protein
MTDRFARTLLHVKALEASLRSCVDQLGFTSPGAATRTAEWMSHRSTGKTAGDEA